MAGHTLTARRGLSLLLVGGYSPENGFNQQLLEYQLATGTWMSGAQSGTPPTGGAGDWEGLVPLTSLSTHPHTVVLAISSHLLILRALSLSEFIFLICPSQTPP